MKKFVLLFVPFIFFTSVFSQEKEQKKDTLFKSESCTSAVRKIRNIRIKDGFYPTFDQILPGAFAGTQITTNGGSPFDGSAILIRRGSSIALSNEPLIIVDGVPLEKRTGYESFSSQINFNDIESITEYRDGSNSAFYGGNEGSNGIISIETKKGNRGKIKFNFSSITALNARSNEANLMSGSEFKDFIQTYGTDLHKSLLGSASTNWDDEIFHNSLSTNNSLSASGGLWKVIPFRASLNYLTQAGTLKNDHLQKINGNLVLNPSFFKDYLKLRLNLSGNINNGDQANQNAIISAYSMDPTKPVTSNDEPYKSLYNGYWQWIVDENGTRNSMATPNPLSILNLNNSTINDRYFSYNFNADYRLHFFPDLRVNFLYANNNYTSEQNTTIYNLSTPASFTKSYQKFGYNIRTLRFGLNYNKDFNSENSITASLALLARGESREQETATYYNGGSISSVSSYKSPFYQSSLIGKFGYILNNAYIVNFGFRSDAVSNLSPKYRTFNSVFSGIAYDIKNGLLESEYNVEELRFFINYGKSGNVPRIRNYSTIYSADLKCETTASYEMGLNFGLFNKLSGQINYYTKKTSDLISYVYNYFMPGSINYILKNVGTMTGSGVEMNLNASLIRNSNFEWTCGVNASYQKSKITYLGNIPYVPSYSDSYLGSSPFMVKEEGYSPNMFYVYQQVYSSDGKPIEGLYVDRNGDHQITYDDKFPYKPSLPDWLFGFNSQIMYKKWEAGVAFHGSIGNYVYNGTDAHTGYNYYSARNGYLTNIGKNYIKTYFHNPQYESSFYIENGSFLKMDNLYITYDFGKIAKNVKFKLTGAIQNVFTITKYTGVDPEVPNGIDFGFYPRPRIFSLKFDFEI